MPNGDPSLSLADWTKIKIFFERLSPILLAFTTAHDVAIDKYYHDSPSWAFRFRHPKGGVGNLEVKRVSESTVRVNKFWYIDEYEKFTHYIRREEGSEQPLAKIDLGEVLEENLKKLLAWKKEDLSPCDAKYPWADYSKEEWERIWSIERFPSLKL